MRRYCVAVLDARVRATETRRLSLADNTGDRHLMLVDGKTSLVT